MLTLSLATLALGGLAPAPQAPPMGDPATIDAIVREGKDHSQVMKRLTELCTKVGPRLTGSPELAKGQAWALAQFRAMGLKNVHLDEWGETPVGFDRGPDNVARLVTPDRVENMVFTTPCWTNGTHGIVKAEAILCPATPEEIEAAKASLAGKWVVIPPPDAAPTGAGGGRPGANPPPTPGTAPAPAPAAPPQRRFGPDPRIAALNRLPIAGIVSGSRNELVVTGGTWSVSGPDGTATPKTYASHPGVPQIQVRKSDCDKILYELEARKTSKPPRPTMLEIGADNRWYPGPVKQYNVVADLVGTEKPDEMVIVSGHFDSWNGPGSQGACDNGTGSMTAMEAARILTKVGAKPKRTIRFILWSGEEQGLYGSAGYVKIHAAELPKVSAVLVDDGGTDYHGGFVGIESQRTIMEAAFAPVAKAFPSLPMAFRLNRDPARMPQGGGSDHASFNRVGVPGFFTEEGAFEDRATPRVNYTYLHHTQHDNLAEAIPEYLVQSSVDHAVVAYNLACMPGLLPREVPPAP